MAQSSTRISQSVTIGGIRLRISLPVLGRGRTWLSAGTRTGRGSWTSVSVPVSKAQRGKRSG